MLKNVMLFACAAATLFAITGCKATCVHESKDKVVDYCMEDLEKSTCEGSSGKVEDKPCAALGYTKQSGEHWVKPEASK
jgi:hypothetical protein